MAISINALTLPVNGERKVREFINSPQGSIEIYEPTLDNVNDLIDIQKEMGATFESDVIDFDGITLLTKVFPLLTNIETGDLSKEELEKIIEHPSIHLLIAQNVVAQIISEANKLFAERLKAEMASAETVMAQSDLINSIPHMINETAKRNPELSNNLQELKKKTAEVLEAVKQEEQAEPLEEVQENDNLPNA